METIDLRVYLDPLRKWWWLLVLSALVAGISSGIYTKQQPRLYQSSTTLMVGTALTELNPSGGQIALAAQLAGAYADIARRSTVRLATQQALGLEWLPDYNVYAVPNTQFIEISVLDTSPEHAQAVAAELANQLILQTPGGNTQDRQSFLEGQIAQIETGIEETNAEIERLEQELTGLFSARQIAATREQIASLEQKVTSLQANYASLLANSRQNSTNTILIVDPAGMPAAPLESDLLVNAAVAAMVGLTLATAGAYLMEYLDQSLRSSQEASRNLNLRILGAIPRLSRREIQKNGPLVTGGQRTPIMDTYAALRLNVQVAMDEQSGRVLLIASPSPSEGKSTVAANLAIDWARSGQKVILVDADLYHPTQQRLFGLDNHSGLTTALVDPGVPVASLIKPSRIKGLSVLTSGPILPNPTPLLTQPVMRNLMAKLREQADIVIIDTPPATAVVDASILARQSDGVLLVLAAGRTKRDLAQHTIHIFQQIRTRILGIALFSSPSDQTFYRQYGAYYGGRMQWPEHMTDQSAESMTESMTGSMTEPMPGSMNGSVNGQEIIQDATWEYVEEEEGPNARRE